MPGLHSNASAAPPTIRTVAFPVYGGEGLVDSCCVKVSELLPRAPAFQLNHSKLLVTKYKIIKI